MKIRPSVLLSLILLTLFILNGWLFFKTEKETAKHMVLLHAHRDLVARIGLTDLALTTEARYTRHPAVSDPVAPFMDHPGAIEHFPSGSFLSPSNQ